MEFHTLTRRELQALCKKNKIPANITNAAMAEALKALKIVEGIEEFMQPSQSETAQSSIESLEGSEVTSPYVAPTAGRSTRRRNVLKEDLEDVTSVNTTRRTTRRTAAKVSHESQVGAIETPALVSQTRRNDQMASACRKMDTQLKECLEEEEKSISMTPAAPLGVTTRRRKAEEGTVQKAYSTRRSVRVAEKNVEMLNDEKTAESELFNNELLTKDNENKEVNLIDGNELSEITGVDAVPTMEENKEKSEVIPAEELDTTHEEESRMKFSAESEPDKEISDNKEFPGGEESVDVCDEVKQSETFWTSDIETTDVAGDSVEHVLLESEDKIAGEEDDAESSDEVEQEFQDDKETDSDEAQNFNMTLAKLTELRLKQQDDDIEGANSDFTNHLATESDEKEALGLEESEKAADDEQASEAADNALPSEEAKVVSTPRKEADDTEEADYDSTNHVATPEQLKKSELDEMETLELEESEKAADEEQADIDNAVASEKNSSTINQPSGVEEAPLAEQIPTSQADQPNKHAAVILSDNKENIGSGTKLVIMKERTKPAKESGENLHDLSVRKLAKMLKEKLEITKKSSNEALPRAALQALPRAALQALPENQATN